MNTENTTDTREYKTLDDVPQRLFFNSREERDVFAAKLQLVDGFGTLPLLFPSDYATFDGYWLFAKNGKRVPVNPNDASEGTRVEPTSLLFTPVPTVDEILADDEGRKMVESLIATKLDHALAARVKKLLEAGTTDPDTVAGLPRTVNDFAVSTRAESDGGLLASYKALSARMIRFLTKNKPWSRYAWNSPRLRYALQSAAWARAEYPEIEAKGGFLNLLASFKEAVPSYNENRPAGKPEISVSLFDNWAANRDTYIVPNTASVADDADDDFEVANPFAGD